MKAALKTVAAALLAAGILAAPASAAPGPWKWCGRVHSQAVSAGRVTSCALARKVATHHADDFSDGQRVAVRSPTTGRAYHFSLYYSDAYRWVVRARGDHGTTLSVQVSKP